MSISKPENIEKGYNVIKCDKRNIEISEKSWLHRTFKLLYKRSKEKSEKKKKRNRKLRQKHKREHT